MGAYRALGWFRWVNSSTKQVALEALERVGMAAYADRQISQLSGGQQRVFLAQYFWFKKPTYFFWMNRLPLWMQQQSGLLSNFYAICENGAQAAWLFIDPATVPQYFDWIVLLNKRVTVCGPVEKAFTKANVCETYGGNIAFLGGFQEALARDV